MKFWCLPSSNAFIAPLPSLPPRTDRDVTWRSPPPPPRLSRQQKLDRGVIVLKPKKNRARKREARAEVKQVAKEKEEEEVKEAVREVREVKTVRYAEDFHDYGPLVLGSQPYQPKRGDVKPTRGTEVTQQQQYVKVSGSSNSSMLVEAKNSSLNSRGGEVAHVRQQSNTSGSSSGLGSAPTPSSSPWSFKVAGFQKLRQPNFRASWDFAGMSPGKMWCS